MNKIELPAQRKLSLVACIFISLIACMQNRLYADMLVHCPWISTWTSDVFGLTMISLIAHSTWAMVTNSGQARTL